MSRRNSTHISAAYRPRDTYKPVSNKKVDPCDGPLGKLPGMVYDPISKRYYAATTSEGRSISKTVNQMREIKKEVVKRHKIDKLMPMLGIIDRLYRNCFYYQCSFLYSSSLVHFRSIFDVVIEKSCDPYKFEVFDIKDDIILGVKNKYSSMHCSLANVNKIPVIKYRDFPEQEITCFGEWFVDVRDMIINRCHLEGNIEITIATPSYIYFISLDTSYTIQNERKYKYSTSYCDRVKLYRFNKGLIIVTTNTIYSLVEGEIHTLISNIYDVKNINICSSTYNDCVVIFIYDRDKKLRIRDCCNNYGINIINIEQTHFKNSIISLTNLLSPLMGMYIGFDECNIVIHTQKYITRKKMSFTLDYGSHNLFIYNTDFKHFYLYSPKNGLYKIYLKNTT